MANEEQSDRRKQITEIMKDPKLSQTEKSKAVQSLMDGRRRLSTGGRSACSNESGVSSHYVTNMAAAAAAAAEYYSSDDEGDTVMSDAPDDIYQYGYNQSDDRSVASSVSCSSHGLGPPVQPGAYRQMHGRSYSLQDWNDNDRVAAAASTSFMNNPAQISRLMEQSRPICQHYERNCTLVSACCGLAFGCRICHDECPVLPPPLNFRSSADDDMLGDKMGGMKKMAHAKLERRRSMPAAPPSGFDEEEENHHTFDRFATREVICRGCYTRQSSKTCVPV
jgi:hypothetical protein